MKIHTILRATSLAMDIYKHDATRQLEGLIRGGIKRRRHLLAPPPSPTQPAAPPDSRGASGPQGADPWEQVKKAMRYVTPENAEKAIQWHGILRNFISKD